jgi:serine/threonine protein phosphatase 1
MTGRTIAIGDVHGCWRALVSLLKMIGPKCDDTLIMLGDYVDRGDHSRKVIETLIAIGQQCHLIPLMGNHEEMMFQVVAERRSPERWLKFGGNKTLESYGFSGDFSVFPADHVAFLRTCRDY